MTRQNLFVRSNEFDNANWVKSGITVSANAIVGPFSGTLADAVIESAGVAQHFIRGIPSTSRGQITVSVYAKNGVTANSTMLMYAINQASFDLAAGTIGPVSAGCTAEMVSLGNGWYRCSLTMPNYTFNQFVGLYANNGGTYNGSGLVAFYLYGAQCVEANWAGEYTETTLIVSNPGAPRNKILKSNLLLQSESFDSGSWAKQAGVTVTANQAIAPDGTLTADLIDVTGAASELGVFQSVATSVLPSVTSYPCTASVWLRSVTGTTDCLLTGVGINTRKVCNLTTEWQRFELTEIPIQSGLAIRNNTAATTELFYAWGAQFNTGNYASDYIATTTTATTQGSPRNKTPIFQNLLLQSQTFDNASWTKSFCTVSANATTAPDGTLTADKLQEDNTNNVHTLTQIVTTGNRDCTVSVYLKAAERTIAYIQNFGRTPTDTGIQSNAYINLTDGSIYWTNSIGNIQVENAGNGWWRISCNFNGIPSPLGSIQRQMTIAGSTAAGLQAFQGVTGNGIYVWGAQLTQSNHSGPYQVTTTAAVDNGAPKNKHFRQNLMRYSQEFDNAAWTKQAGVTVTANQATAPDGTLTADLVDWSAAADSTGVFQTVVGQTVIGLNYARSFWVRAVSGTATVKVSEASGGTLISGGTSTVVTTEWTKLTAVFTAVAGNQSPWLQRQSSSGNVYVWGAQMARSTTHTGAYIATVEAVNDGGALKEVIAQTQNLQTQSEALGSWTGTNATAGSNVIANPLDGALTADSLIDDTTNGLHYLAAGTATYSTGKVMTAFMFVKAGTKTACLFAVDNAICYAVVNLSTGAITSTAGGALLLRAWTESYSDGWWKVNLTFISSNAPGTRLYAEGVSYIGTGAAAIYGYGCSIVQANVPGPYVATTTTTLNTGNRRNSA